ncbi:MAG: hypothetical protein EXS15_08215 [Phycisphaerales bacterium]|nr:hypothetical protein [Phycisphaerales bacterium]
MSPRAIDRYCSAVMMRVQTAIVSRPALSLLPGMMRESANLPVVRSRRNIPVALVVNAACKVPWSGCP